MDITTGLICNGYPPRPHYSEEEVESEEEGEDPKLDSLSQAIAFQVRVKEI